MFEVNPKSPGYRDYLENMLADMCNDSVDDMLLMRVKVKGEKTITYDLVDYQDNKITAMMRTTGFTASIIAQLIVNGEIKEKGVLKQELYVPPIRLIEELAKRNVKITKNYS